MNQVLADIHGKEEANMIETLAIRTMAKASYTTENIGHYGLAFLRIIRISLLLLEDILMLLFIVYCNTI